MKEAFGFTKRLLKRDFSGLSGLAVKNSIYSFLTGTISKVGSLFFTAILVGSTFLIKLFSLLGVEIKPLLSPEIFGLYTLSLSTILIFAGFADLGIGSALVRYISKHGKNSKGFISYIAKLKIILTSIVALVLIFASYFISSYYNKPIFLALIAGSVYIVSTNLMGFISGFFHAENNFRIIFWREILFQILRLIIVPVAIIYSLAYSTSFLLFVIFSSLSICYFLALLFLRLNIKKYKGGNLNAKEKKEVREFIWPLTLTALSGSFFGYIDIIMLGRFVSSEYIAYYQSAFALLYSGIAILSFGAVLFPIFSRLSGSKLFSGLKKSIIVTFPISIIGFALVFGLSDFAVRLIYNASYFPAINILKILSVLFLIDPFISIYTGFYTSVGKTKYIAKVLIVSTIVNIIFNYVLIKSLLPYGEYSAVFGAVIATIISRFVYLGMFLFKRLPNDESQNNN